MKKELSIIILVYNSQEFLGKCIEAVLTQTFDDFNLILVDDASTDKSGEICEWYKNKDSCIQVIHHEQNKGLSCSREDGLKLADTEWVSFIDNDDFIAPDMYECLLNNSDKADVICIRGEDKTTDEINAAVWSDKSKKVNGKLMSGREACSSIYSKQVDFGCVRPIWGKILKKELVEAVLTAVDVYKEELYWVYFEDVLFVPMLFYHSNKVFFDNRLMYMHRHIKNNLSSTLQLREYHYQSAAACAYVLEFFKNNKLDKAYDVYLIDSFLNMQSIWYKVWKNEMNEEKKKKFYSYVDQFYCNNIEYLKSIKSTQNNDLIKKLSIILFGKNKELWGKTIGDIYFKLLRNILY